jgi:uncharacterized cupredoxin-like copper-binding protein
MTMLDFNLWSWNSRIFPGIDPLVVRHNDKVRIRVGNLTMTNHPIHLHGHEFLITGTDGGPTPKSARQYEVTADIAVGQMRQLDFLADEEGDWAFHCHKSHHTMNAMGHGVPTMIGVDHSRRGAADHEADPRLHGDGRARHEGHDRDGDAAARQHRADDGRPGPFGAVGMGGMFSVLKVRKDQKRGDYSDPGWYQHPPGTVAYEFTGACPTRRASRPSSPGQGSMPPWPSPRRTSRSRCASLRAATAAIDATPPSPVHPPQGTSRKEPSCKSQQAPAARRLGLGLGIGAAGARPRQRKTAKKAGPVRKEQKDWGIAGDAKAAKRTIEVGMGDNMRFTPDAHRRAPGRDAALRVRNAGKVMHEFVIGTKAENAKHAELMMKFPNMEHDEPYMAHVPPGKTGEIVWTFNRAGRLRVRLPDRGPLPGGHGRQASPSRPSERNPHSRRLPSPTHERISIMKPSPSRPARCHSAVGPALAQQKAEDHSAHHPAAAASAADMTEGEIRKASTRTRRSSPSSTARSRTSTCPR